jgi:hypothetical protein
MSVTQAMSLIKERRILVDIIPQLKDSLEGFRQKSGIAKKEEVEIKKQQTIAVKKGNVEVKRLTLKELITAAFHRLSKE